MAFIPADKVARVNLQYLIPDGDIAENVWAVHSSTAWTNTTLTALLNAFFTWEGTTTAGATPKQSRSNQVSLISGEARDLTTDLSPAVFGSPAGGPIVGTDTTSPLPNGLSLALKGTTGIPGRSFRSRTFFIGLTVTAQATDKNAISNTFAASLVLEMVNLQAAVKAVSANYDLGVLSLYSGVDGSGRPIPRAAGVFTPITNWSVTDLYIDFQRRRAPAHSRHH